MAKALIITVTFNGDQYLIDKEFTDRGYLDIEPMDALEYAQEYCQQEIDRLEDEALFAGGDDGSLLS